MRKNPLKSRKFWVAVVGAIAIAANDAYGIKLSQEAIVGIIAILGLFIGFEGAKDIAVSK